MSRTRDAGLASLLLVVVLVLVQVRDLAFVPGWIVAGALGTVGLEAILYRLLSDVRELLDRPTAVALSTAIAGTAIVAGVVLAPNRSVSVWIGALGTYLLLLAVVSMLDRRQTDPA